MTVDEFRKLALDFPAAVESGHINHPDFRVAGRVFAKLGYPDDDLGHGQIEPAATTRIQHGAECGPNRLEDGLRGLRRNL